MPSQLGQIRRSQLITTYGVGAIVAVGDQSFIVSGIDRWVIDEDTHAIHEPRLEKELRVQFFAAPPASDDGQDIPVVRFPGWVSCPSCERLAQHGMFTSFNRNRCNACDVPLVPSRFVIACSNGHVDDFPYFRWVHAGVTPAAVEHDLRLSALGASSALRDVRIGCTCGRELSLEGAFSKGALRDVTRCTGRMPWLSGPPAPRCDQLPRTLQRGASNVWFGAVRSALSIPPWSEGVFQILGKKWNILRHMQDESALRQTLVSMQIAQGTDYTVDDFVAAIRDWKGFESPDAPPVETVREAEVKALRRGKPETSARQQFVCDSQKLPLGFSTDLSSVRVARRLREVRVLESFTRVLPPSPADLPERRAPLYGTRPSWLPAIEVTGEGVFLELNLQRVRDWMIKAAVRARADLLNGRYAARFAEAARAPDRTITPQLVLLHTLAHALIHQWSLDCGYPAASLRERLYSGEEMAGLLIYTATSDSAGSLGGVAAQASPVRLESSLRQALVRSAWCSADPLCAESSGQGTDGLNLAACHACVLLPEVSCEETNILLDRALLSPQGASPGTAFFEAT